jgi:predicted Rossmann-fold nucleotide-binding protein
LTREVAHPDITRLHIVTSMHRRKALMSSLSDGFMTLPGGYGTLEEFFETLTWAQIGLHTKPCALLNVVGFWDSLLAMIDTIVADGFVPARHRQLILSDDDPDRLLDRMAVYVPPQALEPVPDLPIDGPPVHRDVESGVDGQSAGPPDGKPPGRSRARQKSTRS